MTTYRWRIDKFFPERKGMPVRVLARGKLNSALFEFADGFKVVSLRNFYRKIDEWKMWDEEATQGKI